MGYQETSYTFEDRKDTHGKIEKYLVKKGLKKLGDWYYRQVYASELATVIVEYDLMAFKTKINVGTQNPEFLEDLVTSFPQMKSK